MQEYQWLANFGFAAVVAGWLLVRFEKSIQTMTRQIWLNTIVLAKIAGQSLEEIERDFCADEDKFHHQKRSHVAM
jgi:hypothetical protein